MAASLVEQLVYEGPRMVARDDLLMDLRNTTVNSVGYSLYSLTYHIW